MFLLVRHPFAEVFRRLIKSNVARILTIIHRSSARIRDGFGTGYYLGTGLISVMGTSFTSFLPT